MQQKDNATEVSNAIVTGLRTLSDPGTKVSGNDIESLAIFKNILRAILAGELVLASPDAIIKPPVIREKKEGDE